MDQSGTRRKNTEAGLLALRKALNLFANIRRFKSASPCEVFALKPEIVAGTDLVVVRELTSGIYFGEPRHLGEDEAYDTNRYRKEEMQAILHQAFQIAQTRNKRVMSVDKANVLATSKYGARSLMKSPKKSRLHLNASICGFSSDEISPAAKYSRCHRHRKFIWDILSDEASVLPGTLGVLSSAVID